MFHMAAGIERWIPGTFCSILALTSSMLLISWSVWNLMDECVCANGLTHEPPSLVSTMSVCCVEVMLWTFFWRCSVSIQARLSVDCFQEEYTSVPADKCRSSMSFRPWLPLSKSFPIHPITDSTFQHCLQHREVTNKINQAQWSLFMLAICGSTQTLELSLH
jgi:hypothetical protein